MIKMKKVLLAAGLSLGALLFIPGIANAENKANFSKKQVVTYDRDESKKTELTCMFRSDMTHIPYVDVEQYLDLICERDSDYSLTGSGDRYTVVGKNKNTGVTGSELTIDTDADTMTFNQYYDFIVSDVNQIPVDLIQGTMEKVMEEPPTNYDFSKYGIDLHAADGHVYIPLSTISDMFLNCGVEFKYVDGSIYVIEGAESDQEFMDFVRSKENEQFDVINRGQDVADFTYSELCFVLENIFGRPEKSISQEFVKKLETIGGFDKALTEGGVYDGIDVSLMKKYLTSANRAEFALGLFMLDSLLFDCGHTFFSYDYLLKMSDKSMSKTEFVKEYIRLFKDDPVANTVLSRLIEVIGNALNRDLIFTPLRDKGFGKPLKSWSDESMGKVADLYVFENTAVFSFNDFAEEVIRTASGEKPFNEALKLAKKKKCNNFVIDFTTNGGGYTYVMDFILSVMLENTYTEYYLNINTGYKTKTIWSTDKNLDGVIDEKDETVKYGFNYAIMISGYTYSCANLASCFAHEAGIPLIGEATQGGGYCRISPLYPEGVGNYYFSGNECFTNSNYQSVDMGIAPDYEMISTSEDGTVDAPIYDPNRLVSVVNKHYNIAKKANPVKVSAKTIKIKAGKLDKKANKVSSITVKSAKGDVNYILASGSKKAQKALSLNRKTGKITIKKKTKKGSYKIKVKVVAGGTGCYKPGSKTVTVVIKVI